MSIQAQPETIFKDLFDQVFQALQGGSSDELQLKRWDYAADKLAKASRGDALEIRAHLAAIRGQDDEVDRLYGAALRETGDYTGAAIRYLVVLAQQMRQEKLLEVYKHTSDAFKGNPEATRFVERILVAEGFMVSAWKLAEELKKMGSFSAADPIGDSERATQVMKSVEYQDADFGAPVAFAKRFLKERHLDARGIHVAPMVSDESDPSVFFQIGIDQSPEDAIETEMELYAALDQAAFPLETQGKIVLSLIGTRAVLD